MQRFYHDPFLTWFCLLYYASIIGPGLHTYHAGDLSAVSVTGSCWVLIVAPMVGGTAAALICWFFIDANHIRDDSEEEEGPLSPIVKALISESDISREKMKDSKI